MSGLLPGSPIPKHQTCGKGCRITLHFNSFKKKSSVLDLEESIGRGGQKSKIINKFSFMSNCLKITTDALPCFHSSRQTKGCL